MTPIRERAGVAAAVAVLMLAAAPSPGAGAPSAEEAVQKSRALESQGLVDDAVEYLAELIGEEDGALSRSAVVLLEAARVVSDPAASRDFATRAIEHARRDEVLEAAHELLGDVLFAEGLYGSAEHEYELAAEHASGRGPGQPDLKRARCILASGDARAAAEAYKDIADWGSTPGAVTPLAEVGLARSLLVLGHFEEAAEQFERTARVYEDLAVRTRALAGAAESHESAGAHASAVAALELIVTDYPDSYEAVLARERLRTYALSDTSSLLGAAVPDSTEAGASPAEASD